MAFNTDNITVTVTEEPVPTFVQLFTDWQASIEGKAAISALESDTFLWGDFVEAVKEKYGLDLSSAPFTNDQRFTLERIIDPSATTLETGQPITLNFTFKPIEAADSVKFTT